CPVGKIKPSVGDAVAKLIKEKKKKIPDDWFDINTSKGLVNIPLSQIIEDKNQPRKTFNSETIKELANSIKEQGVINPITVRPKGSKYVIIAGERRFLAAQEAGLKSIPTLIRKASKNDILLLSLIENIQREDLNDIDRASALRKLKESTGFTWELIGRKLGLSKRRVLALVGLLDLPEKIKEDIRNKILTEKHGKALRKLNNKDEILKVSKIVKEEKLSGADTLKLVKEVKKSRFGNIAEFDLTEFNKRKNLTSKVIDNGSLFLADLEKIENLDGSEILKEERDRLARTLNSIVLKIKNIIEGLNL
ncbi:MAG: ParB/RepB/Spo0J family partition protein, partial [Actinobacteria bacterium]|nr:ParB/RepB/Spo0J family partition protein [Actinomycetota bacterium]